MRGLNRLSMITVLVLGASSWANAAGVTVTSPTPGATLANPIHVVASATETVPISQMQVWDNGQKLGWYSGSKVDQTYTLSAGSHAITVEDLDDTYVVIHKTTVNYTITSTTSPPPPAAGVTISLPVAGSVVNSPVHVVASATESVAINQMQVWDNGVKLGAYPGSKVDQTYTLKPGSHQLTIFDTDNSFVTLHKTTITYYVATPTGGSTGTLPTPPANAVVISGLNLKPTSAWKSGCTGACSGCPNGISCTPMPAAANFNFTTTASPSMDGQSDEFQLLNSPAYSSVLWALDLGAQNSASHFLYDFYVMVDSTAPQSLEFDFWQAIAGTKYMMGTQCNYSYGTWDGWNESTGHWVHTTVPCVPFTPNSWHHVVWAFQRLSNGTFEYVALQVDGVTYAVNLNEPSRANSGWGDSIGIQIQLDANHAGSGYTEWFDRAKVTVW